MSRNLLLSAMLGGAALALVARAGESSLDKGFADPPMSARPWLYWFFMGGYGNKAGLARDAAAFREKGIGGVTHMQHHWMSQPLPRTGKMLSDGWGEWFGEAVRSAGENGLEMIASDVDGQAFGHWCVKPEEENKKLVYSQIQVEGPMKLSRALPAPPRTRSNLYREVALLAFPVAGSRPIPPAEVTASSAVAGYCGEMNYPPQHAADGDPNSYWRTESEIKEPHQWPPVKSPPAISAEHPAWLQLSYHEPLSAVGALVAARPGAGPRECQVLGSEDGTNFTALATFAMGPGETRRVSFPETWARHFRLQVNSAHVPDVQVAEFAILRQGDEPVLRPGISWWDFKSANRGWWRWPGISWWEFKSANRGEPKDVNPYEALEAEYPQDGVRDLLRSQVVDLSDKLTADGHLDWEVPAGRWIILRFGWTGLFQPARTAVDGGFEVDVLGVRGADLLADVSQKRILEIVEKAGARKALKGFHMNSWEIGADTKGQQPTWTWDFREQFRKRRGYDLLAYLPAMARYLVDDRHTTERFLRDYRDTVSDLITEFWTRRQQRAHEQGMLINAQSGYGTYPYPHIDGLTIYGRTDQCQGELWIQYGVMTVAEPLCDVIRTPASGARIYGRQLVQAEFDGAGWAKHRGPNDLVWRQALHRAYAQGLNLAVFNHVEHQPFEDKPGNVYYYMLSRHSPWWPMADATLRYMGRCQFLLQQGLFAADAAYFVGEGASRFVQGKEFLRPALPSGFDFDGINAEVLFTRAKVKDGRLTLPDGLNYRYLVLCEPQCRTMNPATLERIKELVEAGLTLVGKPPERAPGLGDRERADTAVKALVAELWGDAPPAEGERQVGKGRVIWGRSMEAVAAADKLAPDVNASLNDKPFELQWIHRRTAEAEIYFLANPNAHAVANVRTALRVTGRPPELFDAMTGKSRQLPQYKVEGDCTVIPLTFEPNEAYFILFRDGRPSSASPAARNFPEYKPVFEVTGPWRVSFDRAWLYPWPEAGGSTDKVDVAFEKLEDWTLRPEPAIRHYSGLATYTTRFQVPEKASRMALTIGGAGVVARIRVNGQDCGVVSCPPWRVDISLAVQAGENRLEIEVANNWNNRLIGDAALPEEQRRAKTVLWSDSNTKLFAAGLLGPVRILVGE